MDIFGIGPLELVLIMIVALIVMGPNDMAKAGRTVGRTLRMIVTSQTWQVIRLFMKEMRGMPNRLMRESQFDEVVKEVSQEIKQPIAEIKATAKETNSSLSAWANPGAVRSQTAEEQASNEIADRTIAPPDYSPGPETRPDDESSSENTE